MLHKFFPHFALMNWTRTSRSQTDLKHMMGNWLGASQEGLLHTAIPPLAEYRDLCLQVPPDRADLFG